MPAEASDDTPLLLQARALLQRGDAATQPVWPAGAAAAVALGWALKEACYEIWNREPALAGRASALLGSLHTAHDLPVLAALAHWTRGIADLGNGHMDAALAALDAAAAAFDGLGDAAHAAQTQVPRLMALTVLGRHEAALTCGEDTLQRFAVLGDARSAGKVELNLGTLLFRQDRHAEAADRYRSAARRFAEAADDEHITLAEIGLANALSWRFEFDAALRVLAGAQARAEAGGLTVLSAQARLTTGQLELHRGQPHRALPELVACCRLFDQAGSLPHQVAEGELALADAYLQVNLLPEAVALSERVMARCSEHGIADELARAQLQRALALARLGEATQALAELDAAAALFDTQDNPVAGHRAALLRAALWLQQGQSERALETARAAAAGLEAAGVPGWAAAAELSIAEALAARATLPTSASPGAIEAARAQYEHVLTHPGRSSQTDWRAQAGLAALAHAEGRLGEARARLEQALAAIEAQRAALPGDELRTAFGTDKAQAYDRLIALAAADLPSAQGTATSAAAHAACQALARATERARARALSLTLAERRPAAQPGADAQSDLEPVPAADEPGEPGESLRTRLAWLNDQAERALAQGQPANARRLDAQARTLEAELLEAERRARLFVPSNGMAAGGPGIELAAVRAALADDEAWVQYHLFEATAPFNGEAAPQGGGAAHGDWIAWVVTHEAVSWHRGSAAGLDERLTSLRFQLDALRGSAAPPPRHAAQLLARTRIHLQALHTQFWAPLAAAIGGRRRVGIAAHRGLHYLPFAALHDGGAWLVEHHELSLHPSAGLWLQARRTTAPRWQRLLALGVGGETLPQVRAELEAVAACFDATAVVLAEAQATRARWQSLAGTADVLHLACHARFRADSPYFSALHLADGTLTLREIEGLRLRPALVVLSACETGLSRVAPGDEVVGLVRGFQIAGARCVLASLWAVDDGSTAELMADFYAALATGQSPAAALRSAQAARAAAGVHPFHWAAFTLHGDPGEPGQSGLRAGVGPDLDGSEGH
jgi:tetratricopeptide (TPR) repeat protein